MSAVTPPPIPQLFPRLLSWPRLKAPYITSFVLSIIWLPGWESSYAVLIARLLMISTLLVLTFGVLERWPTRPPDWLARWVLQVAGVAVVIPFVTAMTYGLTTFGDATHWWLNKGRLTGFSAMTMLSLLIAPWMAIAALLKQIRGEAQQQALAFELERSEFERNAVETRLRLLQAQVEPHFLFNTLANVRELVDSGSPQASVVLGHLIAYLRAAVPRLHGPATTLQQEIDLVRAYLEVMHMRMPDRLQFTLQVDDAALPLKCPPMTLLTLVENAVRHGVDPSEEGGRIEVRARVRNERCRVEVIDTGVGLKPGGDGLGTGLANLRERLQLAFAGDATVSLAALEPHGLCAEVEFPAQRSEP
jgi:signal transduction histidine kinase